MLRFSIVMPCFNAAATLAETLDSILGQSFGDWELICVDDGSTDGTAMIIADYARHDRRISLHYNPDTGPSSARNFGALVRAKGEIIAFCDADDLWASDKLQSLHDVFAGSHADAIYGQIGFFDDDPSAISTVSTVPMGTLQIETLLGENPVCTVSNISIRRESLGRYGGFDPTIVHNEDLEWLIRLVGSGCRIIGLDQFHVWYRASPTGLSADLEAMAKARAIAIKTAHRFGVETTPQAEAVHMRYLARRALRMGQARQVAARFAVLGMLTSPSGFLSPPRRGVMTLAAAFTNFLLPRALARRLFS